MKTDEILSNLSDLPFVWTNCTQPESISFEFLTSLLSFLENNTILSYINSTRNLHSSQIPYHQSIIHFLIHYTYYPKIPFIIKTAQMIIFGSFFGKNHSRVELSFIPIDNASTFIEQLEWLISSSTFGLLLKKANVTQILIRDIPDELIPPLRKKNDASSFTLFSLRQINYQIYNLRKTIRKSGKTFRNLRWHLNSFNRAGHSVKNVKLEDHVADIIHLIGEWKRLALKQRGFSFVNLKSDKLATRLFGEMVPSMKKNYIFPLHFIIKSCVHRVLMVDGKIKSFQFGYPLRFGSNNDVFAHAVGITDISIPHLAEYAQYDFWIDLYKKGYSFVNDGPSWKYNLEKYKQKFRPIAKKRYYYVTIKI